MSFNEAIAEGARTGTIIGVHRVLGVLMSEAKEMLRDGSFKNPRTPEQKGCRTALRKLGYIRRNWFGSWKLTDAGRLLVENGQ